MREGVFFFAILSRFWLKFYFITTPFFDIYSFINMIIFNTLNFSWRRSLSSRRSLIYSENQWTGLYVIGTSVMKDQSTTKCCVSVYFQRCTRCFLKSTADSFCNNRLIIRPVAHNFSRCAIVYLNLWQLFDDFKTSISYIIWK